MDKIKARFPKDCADLESYGLAWSDFYTPPAVKRASNGAGETIEDDPLSPYGEEEDGVVFREKVANPEEED